MNNSESKKFPIIELRVIVLLTVFYSLYVAYDLLFPIFLALLLYFIYIPVVRKLSRFGIKKFFSSIFIVTMLISIFGGVITLFSAPAVQWINKAPSHFHRLDRKLNILKKPFEKISKTTKQVSQITNIQNGTKKSSKVEVKTERSLGEVLINKITDVLYLVAASFLFLFFLLIYGENFFKKLGTLVRPDKFGQKGEILNGIENSISKYLITITLINSSLGIVIGITMYLLKMPNPFLWGLMATVLNFIPYLGALMGTGIMFLAGFITFESNMQIFLPGILYFLFTLIEGNFITPTILGNSIKINPLLIIFTVFVAAWLWGIGGAVISVPLLSALKVMSDHIIALKKYSVLFSSDKELANENQNNKYIGVYRTNL